MITCPLIPAEDALKNQIADLSLPQVKYAYAYAYAGKVTYVPGGKLSPRMQPDLQLVLLHTGGLYVEVDSHGLQALASSSAPVVRGLDFGRLIHSPKYRASIRSSGSGSNR